MVKAKKAIVLLAFLWLSAQPAEAWFCCSLVDRCTGTCGNAIHQRCDLLAEGGVCVNVPYAPGAVCDASPPLTTDNIAPIIYPADADATLTCTDDSLCKTVNYCAYPSASSCSSWSSVEASPPSNSVSVNVPVRCLPEEAECTRILSYFSQDVANRNETVRSSPLNIQIDNRVPQLTLLSASPNPFSPNGDGLKDNIAFNYSFSEETGFANVSLVIYDVPPRIVALLINKENKASGNYIAAWDGRSGGVAVPAFNYYVYNLSVVDRGGNSNSTSGYVSVDTLSGPEFIEHSPNGGVYEFGTPVVFSATLIDPSGVDSAIACKTDANCKDELSNAYCRMENTTKYRDKFSCPFIPSAIGTFPYYIFANDTQNIFSNVSGSFRVRNVSIELDSAVPQFASQTSPNFELASSATALAVAPQVVDMQSKTRIEVDYLENGTSPIDNATCTLSGDLSGTLSGTTNPYWIEVSPPRPDTVNFVVVCSKAGFPSKSISGSFLSRDLNVLLGFEFDPLAKDLDNILYAYVSTVNDYSPVETADIRSFSITGPNGFSRTGDFGRNSTTKRWETVFKPPSNGTYTANADFRNSDNISGSAGIQMVAEDGALLSSDVKYMPVPVVLGSSTLINLNIENRRKKDMVYTITFSGSSLTPLSFDGQDLSSRRYSTFVFVPANTIQSHPLLIKGLVVSPYVTEVLIRLKETTPPYQNHTYSITYTVLADASDGRKFAPDLSFFSLLPLLFSGALLLAQGKYFKI